MNNNNNTNSGRGGDFRSWEHINSNDRDRGRNDLRGSGDFRSWENSNNNGRDRGRNDLRGRQSINNTNSYKQARLSNNDDQHSNYGRSSSSGRHSNRESWRQGHGSNFGQDSYNEEHHYHYGGSNSSENHSNRESWQQGHGSNYVQDQCNNVSSLSSSAAAPGNGVNNNTNNEFDPRPQQQPLQQPQQSILEIISEKDFQLLTYEEKLREQLSKVTDSFHWNNYPVEIKKLLPHEIDRDKTKDAWLVAIKVVAAAQKKKQMEQMGEDYDSDNNNMEEDDDDDDDDDSCYNTFKKKKGNPEHDFTLAEVTSFFSNLRKNLVFDLGFRVKGLKPKDDLNCWCPCGKIMSPWRRRFELDYIVDKYKFTSCGERQGRSAGSQRMTPMGLMGHLETKKETCVLHLGIDAYLRELYGDLWGGVGHKALHKLGDKQFKAAEAMENQEKEELYNNAIYALQEEKRKSYELEQENQRKEEEIAEFKQKLKETNKDRYDQLEDLNANFKALNIERALDLDTKKQETYSKEDEDSFDMLRNAMLTCLQFDRSLGEREQIKIKIDQRIDQKISGFDINEVLNKQWKKHTNKMNANKQRQEENETHTATLFGVDGIGKFVVSCTIELSALNSKDKVAIKKEDQAIDEGGPIRQFFSEFWEQMGEIEVKHEVCPGNPIKLFSSKKDGICPTSDLDLEEAVERVTLGNRKTMKHLNDKINQFYRVVGVVMFLSIAGQHSIAHKAMSRFLRNVIIRNSEPKDIEKYPSHQVLEDSQEMMGAVIKVEEVVGKTFKELQDVYSFDVRSDDEASQKITNENFITKFMQKISVERYGRAIKFIKLGITLDGQVDLTPLFSKPIDLVSKKFFAKASLSADDVIGVMHVRPGDTDTNVQMMQAHANFLQGPIADTIREMNGEERAVFVAFCTGFNYLPHDDNFHIEVEFSSDNDYDLPVAHTCSKQLVLPLNYYNNNKNTFKEKLWQAMSFTGKLMTMN